MLSFYFRLFACFHPQKSNLPFPGNFPIEELLERMQNIEARHFTAEPIACAVCLELVQYKKTSIPEKKSTLDHKMVSPHEEINPGPFITQQVHSLVGQAARVKTYGPGDRARKLAKGMFRPEAPSMYRGARFYLGSDCKCNTPICADCADVWRKGEVNLGVPKYWRRRSHCPGCRTESMEGCEKVLPHNGAGQGGILPHLSHPMQCNSSIKLKPVLNGIWHNACPYDLQCIIRSIIGHRSLKDARISVLPKTFNTYRSATISLGNGRQIKFVNSFQFVASPLDEI